MCGIAGWIDWERDLTRERPVLDAMGKPLACRGPDADAVWVVPRCGFVHRRLVVVDPAGGAQPMIRSRGDRTCVITYNGELYNTPELRRELQDLGYAFRGHSDTEVLLTSYLAWGPDCVAKLNGIFAFGIWDAAAECLFLARDRLGVKPLFYARRGSALLFGSEPKALLAHPLVPPAVGDEGLAEVLFLGPQRTPGHGVFQGVEEVLPGTWLRVDRNGVRRGRYWRLESRPHPDDLETTVRRVRDLLRDTVTRQLVSDVPVCTLLSGGLDSSGLTALAALGYRAEGKEPLETFSVDYVDNDRYFQASGFQPDADAPWVRRVSEAFGTRHHAVVLDTPQLVDALGIAVRARDLPGMADIDASLYLFSREIKQRATVALSGECADEVFGGYPWFHQPAAVEAETFPWTRNFAERERLFTPEVRARVRPAAYLVDRYRQALAEVPRLEGEGPREARRRELSYLDLFHWMPVLLDRKDRMSMAVGLEVRVPYCDHRLVEYVWNVPWAMKTCGGQVKGLLRRALRGILPDDVLERRKSPYPKTHDPAYLEAVRRRVAEILGDPGSPLLDLIDREAVRELARADAPPSGTPFFGQLMARPQMLAYLVQIDTWLREYRVRVR